MQGMSSTEWSAYLRQHAGVRASEDEIVAAVLKRLLAAYRDRLPLLPGAVDAVHRMAARWPLGLASSSNRPVIDAALRSAGLDHFFKATVSSEEVPNGKPAPDVYLEAARQLGCARGGLRRGRGLDERHPRREGRPDVRRCIAERAVPAFERRAAGSRSRSR